MKDQPQSDTIFANYRIFCEKNCSIKICNHIYFTCFVKTSVLQKNYLKKLQNLHNKIMSRV